MSIPNNNTVTNPPASQNDYQFFQMLEDAIQKQGKMQQELSDLEDKIEELMQSLKKLLQEAAMELQSSHPNSAQLTFLIGQIDLLKDKVQGLNEQVADVTAQEKAATDKINAYKTIAGTDPSDDALRAQLNQNERAGEKRNGTDADKLLNLEKQLKELMDETQTVVASPHPDAVQMSNLLDKIDQIRAEIEQIEGANKSQGAQNHPANNQN